MRRSPAKRILRVLLALVLAAVLGYGVLLGAVCLGERDDLRGDEEVIIVLGCMVNPNGQPSVLLKDRLDTALGYLEEHPGAIAVVSGGQGPDEVMSEAQCMADYLTGRGIDARRIILEDQSHNTNQNIRNAQKVLAEAGYDTTQPTIVVSNAFHLARVRLIWSRACSGSVSTLAAPSSHLPSRILMYVREPLALLKSFLLDWR